MCLEQKKVNIELQEEKKKKTNKQIKRKNKEEIAEKYKNLRHIWKKEMYPKRLKQE